MPPSNSPRPPKATGPVVRTEVGEEAGEHLIALLPVAARHVEAEFATRSPHAVVPSNETCVRSVAN